MRETVCLLTKQECDNDIGQQQQQQLGMFYYTPSQAYSFLAPLLVNQPYEFPRSWGATNSDPPGGTHWENDLPSGYDYHSHGIDGPNRNRWFTY